MTRPQSKASHRKWWMGLVAAAVLASGYYALTSGRTPSLTAASTVSNGVPPSRAVTQHDLTDVLGAALAFEVDPGLPSAGQLPVGAKLPSSVRSAMISAAEARVRTIYAPTSPQLSTAILGVQNSLASWSKGRVLAGGVQGLKLRSMSVAGSTAEATWAGTLWSVISTMKPAGGWSTPRRTQAAATGTASFIYHNGSWLVTSWNISYTPGGGGP